MGNPDNDNQNDKVTEVLDTVIAVLTKSNTIAMIAGAAVNGIFALMKSKGVEVPEYTQEELNAVMREAADHVVSNATDLQEKIRAEFPNG